MPKWRKGATEFTVGVSYDDKRGDQMYLPKPVVEALGRPERVTFVLKGKRVEVKAST